MNITRALVVDDSKTARISLKKQMEKRGIQVDVAEDGEEALSYLRNCSPLFPEIIFMDIMMPGIDGLEATKEISSSPETSTIPVIMCTSKDDEKTRMAAEENGAIGFAVKPIKGDELDRVLQLASAQIAELDQALESADLYTNAVPEVSQTPQAALVPTLSAQDESMMREQITNIAQEVTTQIATQVATEVGTTIAQRAAQQILESAESAAIEKAQAVASNAAEDIALQRAQQVIEGMSREMVKKAISQEIENVRGRINKALAEQVTNYLRSAEVSTEMQRVIKVNAVEAATEAAQRVAAATEEKANASAQKIASSAVRGAKIMTYLNTMLILCVVGYVAASTLKLI